MNLEQEVVIGIPVVNDKVEQEDFPSKIGGYPIWLSTKGTPTLKCTKCQAPLKFLLQIFAVLPFDHSFYRNLYVFICMSKECWNKAHSIRVFRNQLPEVNKYISEDDKGVQFLTKQEQISADHLLTKQLSEIETIIMSPEEQNKLVEASKHPDEGQDDEESKTSEDFRHENELIKNYLEDDEDEFKNTTDPEEVDMLDKLYNETQKKKKDEAFDLFSKLISPYPRQILRYCKEDKTSPLWISDEKIPPTKDIPKCPKCGAARTFEFQLNSQILDYIPELLLLDWGVIAVYTCKNSCFKEEEEYIEEHVLVQLQVQEMVLDEKTLVEIAKNEANAKPTELKVITDKEEILKYAKELDAKNKKKEKKKQQKKKKALEKKAQADGEGKQEESKNDGKKEKEEDWQDEEEFDEDEWS